MIIIPNFVLGTFENFHLSYNLFAFMNIESKKLITLKISLLLDTIKEKLK